MNCGHRLLGLVCLVGLLVCQAGCLVTSNNRTSYSGAYVSPEEVRAITLGTATPEVVETALGPPTRRKTNDDGSELWTWTYTESKSGEGTVLLLFAGSSERTEEQSVHVLFRDGVAVKKWRS